MSNCNCGSSDNENCLSRRKFLKNTGAGVIALSAMGKVIPVMAGPFSVEDFERIAPRVTEAPKTETRSTA
jgi:hypothetical protein